VTANMTYLIFATS